MSHISGFLMGCFGYMTCDSHEDIWACLAIIPSYPLCNYCMVYRLTVFHFFKSPDNNSLRSTKKGAGWLIVSAFERLGEKYE